MRTKILVAAVAAVAVGPFVPNKASAAPLANGDFIVVQVGDGSGALTANSTLTFLKEFSPTGTLVQTIALPTSVSGLNQPLTLTGNGTSEGYLSLSTNGQYLVMGGYNVAPGVASPSTAVGDRVVARIDMNGNIDTTTIMGDNSANNTLVIRSVASVDGSAFWIGGSALGVRYEILGDTGKSTRINTGLPANVREVNIFNGQLYASSATGAYQGVGTVGTGLPTTTGNTGTLFNGFPTSTGPSPNDFVFGDANTVYVADDRTPANGGGIQKWTFNSGTNTWSIAYTLAAGLSAPSGALRGLSGLADGAGNEVFYATTALNTIVKITDQVSATSLPASESFTTLATAPANTAFRDVVFLPIITLSWVGSANGGAWDTGAAKNWWNPATDPTITADAFFGYSNAVVFNDAASNFNVSLNTTVSPGSTTINNSQHDYTIAGSGGIGGPGGLTKTGTGAATLMTANSYTGATIVQAGTLTAGVSGALPAGTSLTIGTATTAAKVNAASGIGPVTTSDNVGVDHQPRLSAGPREQHVDRELHRRVPGNGDPRLSRERIQ